MLKNIMIRASGYRSIIPHFAALAVFGVIGLCIGAAKALVDAGCYIKERIQHSRGRCIEGKCQFCKNK